MKATVKAKYDVDKKVAASVATLSIPALGDSKLKLSLSEFTFLHGPSLDGLSLSLEKPGHFIFDYSFPSKDFRFQFMNTIRVLEKPLSLTYIHFRGPNRTTLDGTLTVDPANKLTTSYDFASGGCRVRYAYAHGDLSRTTFEPAYDLRKGAWDFAVSRKFEGDDVVRATYKAASGDLVMEWSRDSKTSGIFKIAASMNLGEEFIVPKITAETTWNYDV